MTAHASGPDANAPPATPGAPLLRLHADGRATLTLNRPAHHNRLHVADLLALQAHCRTLAAHPGVRVLVLEATGPSFCSGFHLGEFAQTPEAASAGPRLFEETVDALAALSLPTVCRLHGSVFGGATDLALACDFRVGLAGLVLRMPAARIGLHYYPSGLQRFVSQLGLAAAKRLFLLAETVDAGTLLQLGYLDHLAATPAALDAEVDRLAGLLAGQAPLAVRGMKASLNDIARGDAHLATLRAREAQCATSADLQEGMAAAAAKRVPRFVGH